MRVLVRWFALSGLHHEAPCESRVADNSHNTPCTALNAELQHHAGVEGGGMRRRAVGLPAHRPHGLRPSRHRREFLWAWSARDSIQSGVVYDHVFARQTAVSMPMMIWCRAPHPSRRRPPRSRMLHQPTRRHAGEHSGRSKWFAQYRYRY